MAIHPTHPVHDGWRQTHLGRLMGQALRRFDARVLQLMARNVEVPLALSNLAARDQVSAAHVHITRHLSLHGDRLVDLARRVHFTPTGLAWLEAFRGALAQAEAELRTEVGADVAAVVAIGLETYASGSNPP